MGEKVLLLIAALELWPALWNTKGRSDTLQWLGFVNICPTDGMPAFSTLPQHTPQLSLILTSVISSQILNTRGHKRTYSYQKYVHTTGRLQDFPKNVVS